MSDQALDALARQLEQAGDVIEDLRLLLKEDRSRLMRRELDVENLTRQVASLEERLIRIAVESEARHLEIERLAEEVTWLRSAVKSRRGVVHQLAKRSSRLTRVARRVRPSLGGR